MEYASIPAKNRLDRRKNLSTIRRPALISVSVKKLTIYIMVGIGHLVDFYLLQDGNALRTALIFFYAANELVSLIENAAVVGLPVPQVLQDALIQIKKKSGGKSNDKEDE